MPTPPREPPQFSARESHHARQIAESFGLDPERYDRTRPTYPQAMVERIIADTRGRNVLDVGIGTGISAGVFQAAGCRVLGVEVDARMADFARRNGFAVEVAKFEDWDPAGRTFDIVISGQTWHWVDPIAGPRKAAEVLGPSGRLAVFWNVFEPPAELAAAFAAVYRRVLPDSPFSRGTSGGVAAYSAQFAKAANGIRATGLFSDPAEWRFEWERRYTRDEWLDQVPSSGGHALFPPAKLRELLAGMWAAIDEVGGSFMMRYVTAVVTATRADSA
jgi:SAM-dependent methyltransferase